MIVQKDYVLRMIEMMGDFFRQLGDMLDEKERLDALNAACREYCGMSLEAAHRLDLLSIGELLTPKAVFVMSEIFYLEARVRRVSDEEKAEIFLPAARLLASLSEESELCALRSQRLKEMMGECGDLLTSDDYIAAAKFFSAGEHFDFAEDSVFLAVETAEDVPYYVLQGRAVLCQMLTLPDLTLTAGGLPRADVERALDDLGNP